MKTINKKLMLLAKMARINTIRQLNCFIDSRNIQNTSVKMNDFKVYGKLVNAGGLNVKGLFLTPDNLCSAVGVTALLGLRRNIPILGEVRYSDINPGIGKI